MKIQIITDKSVTETEVTVRCSEYTPRLARAVASLALSEHTVCGKCGGELFFVRLGDILYFEAVDGKAFFYTDKSTYEAPSRLSGIEESLDDTCFARISKNAIVNLRKVRSIRTEPHARLCATLSSGEKLIVSRQYVQEIKSKLGV